MSLYGFYMALLALVYLKMHVSPLFTQMSELVYLDENTVPFFFVNLVLLIIYTCK